MPDVPIDPRTGKPIAVAEKLTTPNLKDHPECPKCKQQRSMPILEYGKPHRRCSNCGNIFEAK